MAFIRLHTPMILTQIHTLQAGNIQMFHLYKAQLSFCTKVIYRACFQKGYLSASSVSQLSTPWEGLGLFYFQRKGPRSHCFLPTFSLLSPSATCHTATTFSLCPCPPQAHPQHPPHWRHFTQASVGTTLQLSQPP